MDYKLKDILERGLDLTYDGDGYLKRWEWRGTLEKNLEEYYRLYFEQKKMEQQSHLYRPNIMM